MAAAAVRLQAVLTAASPLMCMLGRNLAGRILVALAKSQMGPYGC